MLRYKEVLNRLETESPGTKQRFYWEFLEKRGAGSGEPILNGLVHGRERPAHLALLRHLWTTNHRRHLFLLQDDGEGQILGQNEPE
jgi:hypothetical protein